MFCQECGTKNDDSSMFCAECGSKLNHPNEVVSGSAITNQPTGMEVPLTQPVYIQPQAVPAPPRKPMSTKKKVIIGVVGLLLILIVGGYNVVKSQFSPEKVTEKFFVNAMNAKWGEVYDYLDLPKSEFITKDKFVKMEADAVKQQYSTYSIKINKKDENALGLTANITYRLKGESDDVDFDIKLIKQKKKSFFFFDSWKIDSSYYITKDYTIHVPKDATVTFGCVQLGSSYVDNSDEYGTVYKLPTVFNGDYDIKITQKNMEDIVDKVSTSDMEYQVNAMTLKKEVAESLVTKAQDTLNEIYKAGLSGSDFSAISKYFSKDETVQSDATDNYDYFLSKVHRDDGMGIQTVNLRDFTGTAEVEMIDGVANVKVELSYSYDLSYKDMNYWTNEVISNTYTGNGSSNFTYVLENNEWVVKTTDFNAVTY